MLVNMERNKPMETEPEMEFKNLDPLVRKYMLEEIEYDLAKHRMYYSNRLNDKGRIEYVPTLREAVMNHNHIWLRERLEDGRMNTTEVSAQSQSGYKKTPRNAARTLSEGEFNRYYMRGLCKRAMEEEIPHVVVYRAKTVKNPDFFSERRIGRKINPYSLLLDLRGNVGDANELEMPPGPNSGLSVCI